VSLLLLMPVLPLALAAGVTLWPGFGRLATAWIVALAAGLTVAIAVLAPAERIELPELLVQGNSALVLDGAARPALLLFGGLWLAAALLLTRGGSGGPSGPALLVGLSAAVTLALADGGPLVYAGLLATGYGLYAIMAGETGHAWRRSGRALVVLLVVSDLLIFEMLLSATATPVVELRLELLVLGLVALVLRGAVPPAHAWLPPALAAVSLPTALLLVAVPSGAALFGALRILPQGAGEIGAACALLALAGAAWALLVGIAQPCLRTVLGYAAAATAALLLLAVPAGAGSALRLGWLGLALLACCALVPLAAGARGLQRDLAMGAALVIHGLAAGEASRHATLAGPSWLEWTAPPVAIAATALLTVAVRRAAQATAAEPLAVKLVWLPLTLALAGLAVAWLATAPELAAVWQAPVAITLGLLAVRALPARSRPLVPAGDLLAPVERAAGLLLGGLARACRGPLPRLRDGLVGRAMGLWDGERWSNRMQRLDLRLRVWPATSLMMLLVAVWAAWLLAGCAA
jgi:hypothetical protein